MHTHPPQQRIISLPLHQLGPHPDNANRMSKPKFNKLIRHIKTTGQYEPLVVRRHPTKENAYQILNGHHRLRALRQLTHNRADCVVFDADDEYRKAKLIERLCRCYSPRELAKQLVDSKTAIEKLSRLSKDQPLPKTQEKPFLLPMTFFMTESQHAIITAAFEKVSKDSHNDNRSQKRLNALYRMAEDCLAEERL